MPGLLPTQITQITHGPSPASPEPSPGPPWRRFTPHLGPKAPATTQTTSAVPVTGFSLLAQPKHLSTSRAMPGCYQIWGEYRPRCFRDQPMMGGRNSPITLPAGSQMGLPGARLARCSSPTLSRYQLQDKELWATRDQAQNTGPP